MIPESIARAQKWPVRLFALIFALAVCHEAWSAPSTDGQWDPTVLQWPVVAVHATLIDVGACSNDATKPCRANGDCVSPGTCANRGRVLFWQKGTVPSGHCPGGGPVPTATYVWDPANPTVTVQQGQTGNDAFCSGHSPLADGRVILIGGHEVCSGPGFGIPDAYIFDPMLKTWTPPCPGTGCTASMAQPRWYPTATVNLGDGRLLATGGLIEPATPEGDPAQYSDRQEIYDPARNCWRTLAGACSNDATRACESAADCVSPGVCTVPRLNVSFYPHMFVLPTAAQTLFQAGPTVQTRKLALSGTVSGDCAQPIIGTVTNGPTSLVGGSGSVMYRVTEHAAQPDANGWIQVSVKGKILKSGGPHDGTPDNRAQTIDMSVGSPAWTSTANTMVVPRVDENLVILPDGKVLVVGGERNYIGNPGFCSNNGMSCNVTSDCTSPATCDYAAYHAEMWEPTTRLWSTMAAMSNPRMYHSTALLLPDGRVISAGGNFFNTAQLYSPPYLFAGARPTITSAPFEVLYGQDFLVETPNAQSIASVALIRPGSTTHSFDESQRYVALAFQRNPSLLAVKAPANWQIAPPGYYMLFIVDGSGVPSVAAWVHVAPSAGC